MPSVPSRVLFVCTANQCRSPLAEHIFRLRAADLPVHFASAGLIRGGAAVPAPGIGIAGSRGIDLRDHRSRRFDPADAPGFDLFLTMTREHAREVIVAAPAMRSRVFPLRQFVRWIPENPKPRRSALGSWLDAFAAGRPGVELVGHSQEDDVPDPLRLPTEDWSALADELEGAADAIITWLFPPRPLAGLNAESH